MTSWIYKCAQRIQTDIRESINVIWLEPKRETTMKELSIEEKAKAYDEAIKKSKRTIKIGVKDTRDKRVVLSFFPELKESGDERMIRELIAHFRNNSVSETWSGLNVKKVIAWLEKQGEQMSDPRYSILDKLIEADDIYQMSVNDAMVEEAKNKAIEVLSKLEISKLLELKKQCKKGANENEREIPNSEQKPTEKVEPKFKAGDIIRHKKQGFTCKITAVDTEYRLSGGTHLPFDFQDAWELVEQKPAWSEEDEKMMQYVIGSIDTNISDSNFKNIRIWFEALKERYTWKPSKEQIIALRWVLNNIPYCKHKEEISGLLDQIKDL